MHSFEKNNRLDTIIKLSFEAIVNENNKTSIALARHTNNLLRKEVRSMQDSEIEARLD
jgi:hypothetical protein